MKTLHLEQILKALAPVIKNQSEAKQLLEKYWQNKIALVWTTQQVHRAANEKLKALTETEAISILQSVFQKHDPQFGLCWENLTTAISESDLGRTLTKAELNRFVYHDQITIQR